MNLRCIIDGLTIIIRIMFGSIRIINMRILIIIIIIIGGVMNLIISGGLLLALAVNIAACARKDVGELVTRKPNFVLEEFFSGNSVAFGIFEDRFGNLRRQFRVNLSGKLDGNRLVLDEEFLYDDGERASRVWTIDRVG